MAKKKKKKKKGPTAPRKILFRVGGKVITRRAAARHGQKKLETALSKFCRRQWGGIDPTTRAANLANIKNGELICATVNSVSFLTYPCIDMGTFIMTDDEFGRLINGRAHIESDLGLLVLATNGQLTEQSRPLDTI